LIRKVNSAGANPAINWKDFAQFLDTLEGAGRVEWNLNNAEPQLVEALTEAASFLGMYASKNRY
jgi:hypothetical protein